MKGGICDCKWFEIGSYKMKHI